MAGTTTRAVRARQSIRERREREKQELREAILRAAGELFVEQGYEHFSLRQVAERIGYSATTIYLYFQDKDDLLFAVVDEGFERFGQQLRAAAASTEDPWQRIMLLGRAYISFGLNNPEYYQVMFMQRSDFLMTARHGERKPRVNSFMVLQQAVEEAVQAGIIQGEDVLTVSHVLWAQVHGITSLAITMPFFTHEQVSEIMRVSLNMTAKGLRKA